MDENLKKLSQLIDILGAEVVHAHVAHVLLPEKCLQHLLDWPMEDGSVLGKYLSFAIQEVEKYNGRPQPRWMKEDDHPYIVTHHRYGIVASRTHFLVANHHPGLYQIFEDTMWRGGLWGNTLPKLSGASKAGPHQFTGSYRSSQRCVKLPASYAYDAHERWLDNLVRSRNQNQ